MMSDVKNLKEVIKESYPDISTKEYNPNNEIVEADEENPYDDKDKFVEIADKFYDAFKEYEKNLIELLSKSNHPGIHEIMVETDQKIKETRNIISTLEDRLESILY